MAKRKRKKAKSTSWLTFGFSRKKKSTYKKVKSGAGLRITALIFAALILIAAIAFGFAYLNRSITPPETGTGPAEFVDKPYWLTELLTRKIENAAGPKQIALDETAAKKVARNLQLLPWLYDITARTTHENVLVTAKFRKPVAQVRVKKKLYYLAWAYADQLPVNKDIIVLDYLPLGKLPVIEIKGFSPAKIPPVGGIWRQDDTLAAMEILTALSKMDRSHTPDKPLLNEIAHIDVGNYTGRKSKKRPHIVLKTSAEREILWGAAAGSEGKYLEASTAEKIATLYKLYEDNNSLQGDFKYIELRQPQKFP